MSSRADNLKHLIMMQRKEVPDCGLYGRLSFLDLKRIDLLISGDVTKSSKCCLYNGTPKGNYCTFSFRGKKTSILRILYHNLIDDVTHTMSIKYLCENKGICCNLSHFKFIDFDSSELEESSDSDTDFPENDVHDDNFFQIDL